MKYIALRDFDFAPDCRTTVHIKEGDQVNVPAGNEESWLGDGFVKLSTGEPGEADQYTDVDPSVSGDIHNMDKDQLEAHALAKYGVELDKRKKLKKLVAEVEALG